MQTESELRQWGFEWENVMKAFLWYELSPNFIRQMVEYDPVYKTQLEHHLLAAFHGYSQFASYFYQNMYQYIKLGLAEEKQLACYVDRIYMMYREQREREHNAYRNVYKFIDGSGRVVDQWVI